MYAGRPLYPSDSSSKILRSISDLDFSLRLFSRSLWYSPLKKLSLWLSQLSFYGDGADSQRFWRFLIRSALCKKRSSGGQKDISGIITNAKMA